MSNRLLILLLPLLLAACAPRVLPPAELAPPVAAEVLLERLAESAAAFTSVEGLARVEVDTEERSRSATHVLIAEKPDRLRLETLSPFGQPLLVLATDGQTLDVLVPGQGRLYSDAVSFERLQRLTRLPLQLTDLVHLLLYQVPLLAHERQSVVALAGGGALLTLHASGERRQELRFDRQLRLTGVDYYQDDDLLLRIGYDRFSSDGQPFPMTAALAVPAAQTEATVTFSELRTNVAIPPERFRVTPPKGVEVLPFPE